MPHLVLLGDSIFDNGAYTDGGPDVVSQTRNLLPTGWTASLLAIDGSTTGDVAQQVAGLPADTTHLVLSVGGNDALIHASVLIARPRLLRKVLVSWPTSPCSSSRTTTP